MQASDSTRIPLTDLTDEFATFWSRSQGMEDAARIAALKQHFEPLIPGFYDRAKVASFDYGEFILKALNEYPEKRAGIEEVSRRFQAMMIPALRSFERVFGDFGPMPPIYLLHSLGEMDGGVRTLRASGRSLIFGADVIARNHLQHGIQPFFHHELFHVFHGRRFGSCDAVWCGLWGEGLAVYVAERLNPGATDAQLLLVNPVPLRAAVEANRTEILCSVLSRLDSTEAADHRALFSGGGAAGPMPGRAGYYVGYLLAREAGKRHSLKRLAAMQQDEVRALLETTLRRLATCTR
ncbi:MAG TPA: hypothetical protein VD846_12915 [Allosphingosinicella sp.]|nr:hypothetical protein [Allosphingosinicella sp.]